METKKSINTNQYGEPILSAEQLRELLLQEKNINHVVVGDSEEIALYNKYKADLLENPAEFYTANTDVTMPYDDFHMLRSDQWTFPVEYQKIDMLAWLLNKVSTDVERERVLMEYKMYEERELIMILKLFLYLITFLKDNNYIRGIGRGSSVSSYILYLIGVHKVDSIKYSLPITDFLK
jgi:DNA polymerase III alpha subunit